MKKHISIWSSVVLVVGVLMIIGGFSGVCFTYKSVARENIVTPADATIPETPVRGPLTLKAQADIIRHHTLESTEGKTFAEMSRDNPARNTWVTATTLMTALNLGILGYAFSGLLILIGGVFLYTGILFRALNRKGTFM